MNSSIPLPDRTAGFRMQVPVVHVEPMWEYKHVVRKLGTEAPLDEVALNALGADGWELASVIEVAAVLHFYFKRTAS